MPDRKSFLTYEPISFSLTEGTNIPPPKDSPPSTANGIHKIEEKAGMNGTLENKAHEDTVNLQSPVSPYAQRKQASPRPSSVRRLFSLSSLRSSFSSSRASLALPRDDDHDFNSARPISPSASFVTATSYARPPSRASRMSRRSGGGWFKRKSGFWNGENGLASIGEDGRPESKRLRERSPAPLLPEIEALAGGDLKEGAVDWDDKIFKKPE